MTSLGVSWKFGPERREESNSREPSPDLSHKEATLSSVTLKLHQIFRVEHFWSVWSVCFFIFPK